MKKYVFACIHNAGRSQMAAAFFNEIAPADAASAVSAGTEPADRVHPEVQLAMAEVGIDLTGAAPRPLTTELTSDATALITMGCGERCPNVPGLRVEDWPFPDPRGQSVDAVRGIRDAVRTRVEEFIARELR
ncbi:MAG: low molecular weight phosphatase family protein [Deltaproteobacteria bacterium]|nr:low molecular weight phosphatase family protein [Deltaproteobacteria bacterium]